MRDLIAFGCKTQIFDILSPLSQCFESQIVFFEDGFDQNGEVDPMNLSFLMPKNSILQH